MLPWADYLVAIYIGRPADIFSDCQDIETRLVKRLAAIAVVVYPAIGFGLAASAVWACGLIVTLSSGTAVAVAVG